MIDEKKLIADIVGTVSKVPLNISGYAYETEINRFMSALVDKIIDIIERQPTVGRSYTVTEYDYENMVALEEMSYSEVADCIRVLDRGYFNRYIFPNPNETYSEDEYYEYRIRVALRKVYELLKEECIRQNNSDKEDLIKEFKKFKKLNEIEI